MTDRKQWPRNCAILVFLCAIVYVFFLDGPFLSDDLAIIAANPNIRHLGDVGQFFTPHYWNEVHTGTKGVFRPLREASFTLIYATLGLNPFYFHLASLLLHVAVVVLLYLLARKLLEDDFAALLGAAMFAAHPIHLEAVLWAKNVAEVMAAFFVVLAFMAFLRALRHQGRVSGAIAWCAGASVLYALSLMCKESALALPGILILYALLTAPRKQMRRALAMTAPLMVIGLAYVFFQFASSSLIAAAESAAAPQPEDSLLMRPALVAKTLLFYHRLLLFPLRLSTQYDFVFPSSYAAADTLPWLLGFGALLAAMLAGIALWRRGAYLLVWSVAFLVPAANIIPLTGRPVGDVRVYVASIGPCLLFGLAAAAVWRLSRGRSMARVAAALAIGAPLVAMIALSLDRGGIWHSEKLFWFDMLRKSPAQVEANLQVGEQELTEGRYLAALHRAVFAVDTGQKILRLAPNQVDVVKRQLARSHILAGRCYGLLGDQILATENFTEAVRLAPNMAGAHSNLGIAYLSQDRPDLAAPEFLAATELDPGNPIYLTNLAAAELSRNQPQAALQALKQALSIAPGYEPAAELMRQIGGPQAVPPR